nr:unnamed protein product [Digitaria exilis]
MGRPPSSPAPSSPPAGGMATEEGGEQDTEAGRCDYCELS